MTSNVKAPSHYTAGGIETREYIKAKLNAALPYWPPERAAFIAYCYGNIKKYGDRAPFKGKEIEDLQKMIEYAEWVIAELQEP